MSITVADIPHWRRLFDPTGQPAGYVWTTDGLGGGSYQPAGGGGGNTILVEDEGTPLTTAADTLNFTGVGVTASGTGTTKQIDVPGLTVEDEGTPLTSAADTLDFVGAGVTASGTGTTKTVTIPGGISGITIEDEGTPLTTDADTLNFTGDGVTASGTGTTKTINIPGGGGIFTEDAQANIVGGTGAAASFGIFAARNFVGGFQAYNISTSSDDAVAVGYRAGRYCTGNGNIQIGFEAGTGFSTAVLSGNDNVYIGYRAGVANTSSASFNVAVGREAGARYNTNGNVSIGYRSGTQIGGAGQFNTCVGYEAGRAIGGGGLNNTLIGKGAGRNITNIGGDSDNICLGHEAGPTTTAGASDQLWIDVTQRDDPLIKGNFLTRLLEINGQFDADGNTANVSFRVDNNATAAETRMLLWDVDNATLARVSVGAANSGGAGFKVLRIPN